MGAAACKRRATPHHAVGALPRNSESSGTADGRPRRFECFTDVNCQTRSGEWKKGVIEASGRDAFDNAGYLVVFKDSTCQFVRDDPAVCRRAGGIPWFDAVLAHDLVSLQGSDLSILDRKNRERPVLVACAEENWLEGVQWLLARRRWSFATRADPTGADCNGCTSLHVAAKKQNAAMLEALLKAKASVNAKEEIEDTDEDFAEGYDAQDVFFGLVQKPTHTESALHHAAKNLDVASCGLLLARRAEVDSRGPSDKTPLHLVEEHPNSENKSKLIALLISKGRADPNLGNAVRGMEVTSLCMAVQSSDSELVRVLLETQADANKAAGQNFGGMTPLHIAARKKNAIMAIQLVEARADPSILNPAGKSASDVARSNGCPDMAAFIDGGQPEIERDKFMATAGSHS